jgi:heat shock protein HslJ
MARLHIFLLIAGLTSAACDSNPVAPSDIVGGTWMLTSLQETGFGPVNVSDPTRYTLEFKEDGTVGVKSDCNSCGGPYSLSDSDITIGPVTCTRVFCGDDSLDAAYTRALDEAESIDVDGSVMTIIGDGVRMRFRK